MLTRTTNPVLVLAALLMAGGLGCTSQRAVVIMAPKDAAADTGIDSPMPSPDAAPDSPADPKPDWARDQAPDRAPDTAPDSASDPAIDPASDPPVDPASDPPIDPAMVIALDSASDLASGLLFRDDFSEGYEHHWSPPFSNDGTASDALDGNNPIVTLDATDHSFTRLRCNLDGSLFSTTDITASMRFRVEQASASGRVRLDVRQASATENIFYAVGAVADPDGIITKVGIYKKVQTEEPNYTICALAEAMLDPPLAFDRWRTLKLTVSGFSSAHLTAYLDEVPMATYVDDCVSTLTATNGNIVPNGGCLSGQTGLGIQVEEGLIASVDEVLVTAP